MHRLEVNTVTMDILPSLNIFRELQDIHDTGYFSAQPSLEEHWQQVTRRALLGPANSLPSRQVCGPRVISAGENYIWTPALCARPRPGPARPSTVRPLVCRESN